jgi:hypothetical protein
MIDSTDKTQNLNAKTLRDYRIVFEMIKDLLNLSGFAPLR